MYHCRDGHSSQVVLEDVLLTRCENPPFPVEGRPVNLWFTLDVSGKDAKKKVASLVLLDNQRLAVLADLTEESGCCAVAVLAHLRDPGAVHVTGCWAVEAVSETLPRRVGMPC
jgi:hypothetical protein